MIKICCPPPQLFSRNSIDYSHIRLTYITHFYCNDKNINCVIDMLRFYETFCPKTLDVVMFVIVDDGSPISYEIPKFNLNLRWIRINEDIPWNMAGARNLGVTYALSDNIFINDVDFYLLPDTLEYMAHHKPCGRMIYKVGLDINGKWARGHCNAWFMSRARFMRFFGVDEEFSGNWGREDDMFAKLHKWSGSRLKYIPKKYRAIRTIVSNNEMDTSSYHTLKRSRDTQNFLLHKLKKQEIKTYGAEYGYSKLFLHNFTWKFLSEQRRDSRPTPKPNQWWWYLWYWRWLVGYN